LEEQDVVKLRLRSPLVPPPVRPLPLAVVTPAIVPRLVKTMSHSAGWLWVEFSLRSNEADRPLLATSVMPSFGCAAFSYSSTAEVTSISRQLLAVAVVRGTPEAIEPSVGTRFAVMFFSAQLCWRNRH